VFHLHQLTPEDAAYPEAWRQSPQNKAPIVSAIGDLQILQRQKLALFCSGKCPGNLILQTYDLTQTLRDLGITVISGFHSPMEQECLTILLRGTQPVIYCPARSLEKMRLKAEWQEAITQQRLLLLSPFRANQNRATAELAQTRNEFVAGLGDIILVIHAHAGSKTGAIALQALNQGKQILTLDSPDNQDLLLAGVQPVHRETISHYLK
jgi:predicted Rossmann fold nucleotide-binding protein DprA/Smf involved in DNA uptake